MLRSNVKWRRSRRRCNTQSEALAAQKLASKSIVDDKTLARGKHRRNLAPLDTLAVRTIDRKGFHTPTILFFSRTLPSRCLSSYEVLCPLQTDSIGRSPFYLFSPPTSSFLFLPLFLLSSHLFLLSYNLFSFSLSFVGASAITIRSSISISSKTSFSVLAHLFSTKFENKFTFDFVSTSYLLSIIYSLLTHTHTHTRIFIV